MLEIVHEMFYSKPASLEALNPLGWPNRNGPLGGHVMAKSAVAASDAVYQCKSCEGEFLADAFYASNLSRCKDCVKTGVRANRAAKLDYYRSYDRARYREQPGRKESAHKCATSEVGLKAKARATARSKREEPEKRQARNAVNNAIRDGRLERGTECFFCTATGKLHAHHYDYSKPFDVFWLCPACHGKLHTINGDFQKPRATLATITDPQ